MSFAAELAVMHAGLFEEIGESGTFTPVGGTAIAVRAVLDEVTHNVGSFAGEVDPRPSVQMLVSQVGAKPRGQLVLGARTFATDRNVDADNDGYVVRVYVREGGA